MASLSSSPSQPVPHAPAPPERRWWDGEETPAWLISLLFHTALLILLTLWRFTGDQGRQTMILARTGPSDSTQTVNISRLDPVADPSAAAASQSAAEAAAGASDPSDSFKSNDPTPQGNPTELANLEPAAISAPAAEQIAPPDWLADFSPDAPAGRSSAAAVAATEKLRQEVSQWLGSGRSGTPDGGRDASLTAARQVLPQGGMAPRTPASRSELGARYGATPQSEAAVEAALEWIAAHQKFNGSWSFQLSTEPCNGRCSHSSLAGDNATPNTAATGLALLAFMGAGYTQHDGKYAENVRSGIYFLRETARPAQFGVDLQAGSMYGHGIATLALTEVLNIDRQLGREDEDIRRLVEDAVLFTMVAQHSGGGWRYVPGSPGDMTVSAWQILSLVSARYGGVPLRSDTLPKARTFVRSLAAPDTYRFGYVSPKPEPATTAIGLATLLYLGESPFQTPFQHAMWELAERGPKLTDVYHDYYAALALHNVRHPGWDRWHVPLREHLIRTQATQGHEKGSWHFKDPHGDVGGRLYTTAMAAMILEVYYRHLPLYQDRNEEEFPLN